MGDSFCIYPWIHTHFQTNGDLKLCCVSSKSELVDEKGQQLNLQRQSLKEIWNSDAMREVRRKMLAGEPVKACQHCDHEEAMGQSSHRVWANQTWLGGHEESERFTQRVVDSSRRDHRVPALPVYYDIRPGNQCNLGCRMCTADSSSVLARDEVHKAWRPVGDIPEGRTKGGKPWYRDEDVLVGELLENVLQARKFLFAGGEPLLNPVIKKVINILIERDAAKNIVLQFSTNMTIFDEDFFAKMAEFKEANFMLSIDGVGAEYEYIRHPWRWKDVADNLWRVRALEHINCTITPTVQNYNALGLASLLDFAEQMGFLHMLNFLYNPRFLSVRVMPEAAKVEAARRLRTYAERSPLVRSMPFLADRIEAAIKEFGQQPAQDYAASVREFNLFCNDLDADRGQSFRESCPELFRYFAEDGYQWTDELRHAGAARAEAA